MTNNFGYLGNPKLRRAYVKIPITKSQQEEIKKCAEDKVYFVRKYIKIIALGKGIVPFDLWDFQEEMIKTFDANRFVICKIPRQSGKTITTVAYLLWLILFKENYNIAILAHKGAAANSILGRLKLAYENLPMWLQHGIIEWNKGNIELENGSKIGAFATGSDGLRSGSFDVVLLDEFAFVPDNIAEAFFTSTYPVISAGTETKIIIVSTPKGMNHFYEAWIRAKKKKSDYIPIEVHWSAVPGRDEKWKEQTIRNTSPEQFQQEFECEFLGSTNTLINPAKLGQLISAQEEPKAYDGDTAIWQFPKEKGTYCMLVDVAEGNEKDYSAFIILDVTEVPYRMVVRYRNSKITPFLYPTIIHQYATKYNESFILVEINGIGLQVADILHYELSYDNLIRIETETKHGQKHSPGFKKKIALGLKHNKQTKNIGCSNLKTIIENDKLIIPDRLTLKEFTTFSNENRIWRAEPGKNDDLVMCLVNFGWLTGQRYFKENIDSNIRQILQKEQMDIEDRDLVPFGIIDDGKTDPFQEKDVNGDLWIEDRSRKYFFDNDLEWEYLTNRHKL